MKMHCWSYPRTLIPVWTLPLRLISSSLSVARPFTNGVEWGWKKCTDPMVGGARSITLYDACTPSSGPCYSAVSALLMNPLPDHSNYSPLCHTHYLTPDQYFTSLFRPDPLPSRELETNTSKFTAAALYCRTSRELSALRKLNNKQRQVSMFLILLFKLLTQLSFVSFLFFLLPFSILSLLPLPHPFFLF